MAFFKPYRLHQAKSLFNSSNNNYPDLYNKLKKNGEILPGEIAGPGLKVFANRFKANKLTFDKTLKAGLTFDCNQGYIKGHCSSGHAFAKAVFCNKEYCPNCGADGSPLHIQRVGRWWGKVMVMETTGYLVLTIPKNLRMVYADPNELRSFRHFIKEKLKRMGYRRGLARWHFFGDCELCRGKGCNDCLGTGSGRTYKPHLNLLIDEAYLTKTELRIIKRILEKSCIKYWIKRHGDRGYKFNAWFGYSKDTAGKIHFLKYVTRSTHRIYNKHLADKLKNFRASQTWGKWPEKLKAETVSEFTTVVNFLNNLCPCCKRDNKESTIKWIAGYYDTNQHGETKYRRKLFKLKDLAHNYNFDYLDSSYYHLTQKINNL